LQNDCSLTCIHISLYGSSESKRASGSLFLLLSLLALADLRKNRTYSNLHAPPPHTESPGESSFVFPIRPELFLSRPLHGLTLSPLCVTRPRITLTKSNCFLFKFQVQWRSDFSLVSNLVFASMKSYETSHHTLYKALLSFT
jgi:hypothetical protein